MRVATQELSSNSQVTKNTDERITKFGNLIRKFKLDELPQLFNILMGQMSFIGPRPEVEKYFCLIGIQAQIVLTSVRPGLTDPSSILFRNEQEILSHQNNHEQYYEEVLIHKKADISVKYIQNRTLFNDLRVFKYTVEAILFPNRNFLSRISKLIGNPANLSVD